MTLRMYISTKYISKSNLRLLFGAGTMSVLFIWAVIGFIDSDDISLDNNDSLPPVVAGTVLSGIYEPLSEEVISELLSVDDVARMADGNSAMLVEFRDGKAMAAGVDPTQVIAIESWITTSFRSIDPIRGLTFSVMDFNSSYTAQEHFDHVISETPGLIVMSEPIGDISANVVFNGAGLGSIVMYREGDLFLSLHTAQPVDVEPMMPVDGLVELARLIETRIS